MLELSEVVRQLRGELLNAIAAAEGEDLRFAVGDIELELTVAVTKEGSGSTTVKFWVLEIGAEGKLSSVSTQKVKFTLSPTNGDGATPYVSGKGAPGEGTGPAPR